MATSSVLRPLSRLGVGIGRRLLALVMRLLKLSAFAAAGSFLLLVLDKLLLGDAERPPSVPPKPKPPRRRLRSSR